MSDKQQTPSTSNVRQLLIVIIAVIVVGTLWFVMQAKNNTDESLDNTKKVQAEKPADKTDAYKGWKSYTWASQNLSFKHPGDWTTKEDAKMDRLYVRNSDVNLLTEETPSNFQQIWFSTETDEASLERENSIKKGVSQYRVVNGEVRASTIKSGDLTINVYEYQTLGGPTLEAYWTTKEGKRAYATTSTEVGQQNQTDMVFNLKKVLATVAYPKAN